MRNEGGHPSVAGRPYLSGTLQKYGDGAGDVMSSFHTEGKKDSKAISVNLIGSVLFLATEWNESILELIIWLEYIFRLH